MAIINGLHQRWRLPFLQGILPLNREQVPAEIIAGLTLAALNIPHAMGYAKIAGTPVITGLYAILIPMSIFALFGSSRHLVVGADSATAAILAAGLAGLAPPGSAAYVALSSLLALMAAALLLIARLFRLGFLADFLSQTVLVGFLTGVGVQVSLMVVGGMLGLPKGGTSPIGIFWHDLQHLDQTNFYTLGVSVAVLAFMVWSKKISPRFPGALVAVIGTVAVSWAIDLRSHGVAILGDVPQGLPRFGLPDVPWRADLFITLLPTAFAIAVVIMAQSAATSRAFAARYHEPLNENQDLVGLCLANLGAGLSGSFMVNGSPTATEMVESAGGKTQLAQITSSVVVLLVLLFLTAPLAYMPEAVLAAVVFLICVNLVDIKGMSQIYRERPWEFWVALITAATVVIVGVEQGILLAMFLSLLVHTRHGYHPQNMVIVAAPGGKWQTQPVSTPAQILPGLLIYRFTHGMYYANAELLYREVTWLVQEAKPPLLWFCIDASSVDDIDYTAAATLRRLCGDLQQKGVRLVLAGVSPSVSAELRRSGITALIGQEAFYDSVAQVLQEFKVPEATAPMAQEAEKVAAQPAEKPAKRNLRDRFYHFVWHLNDLKRAGVCLPFGLGLFFYGWRSGWEVEIAFLAGWNLALGLYLGLLAVVVITADAAKTRQRVSQVDPTQGFLLFIISLVALMSIISLGAILTAVGHRSVPDARLLLGLSVMTVILSWLLLHTAFGQHYARLYYDGTDHQGRPFPEGLRRGFSIPETPDPTYLDFMYIAFTVALTYAVSDIDVTDEAQRRVVLAHSIIAFFFYSTVFGVVLNAIITS